MPESGSPETVRMAFTATEIEKARSSHKHAELVLGRFAELRIDPMKYRLVSKQIVHPHCTQVLNLKAV